MLKEKTIVHAIEVARAEKQAMMVFDDESQAVVKVTKEMQDRAWAAHENLKSGILQVAKSLFQIKSEKLYLALGFNSFQDYFINAGFGKTNAYRHLAIGQVFSLTAGKNVPTVGHENETFPRGNAEGETFPRGNAEGETFPRGNAEGENVPTWDPDNLDELQSLGVHKLYDITRFTREQINELLAGGTIFGLNGDSLNLEELRQMSAADAGKKISEMMKKKDKEKISTLKGDVALLKEEKRALLQRIKNLENEMDHAKQLREKYEPIDRSIQAKTAALRQASKDFASFLRNMNGVQIEANDPADLIELFKTLVGSIETYIERNVPVWWGLIQESDPENIGE